MIKEIIQAGATGDAFGYQVEFDDIELIKQRHGAKGLQYQPSSQKSVSDDTQMTLFLLESVNSYIAKEKVFELDSFIELVHAGFNDWYFTQTQSPQRSATGLLSYEELYKAQAPGVTCMSALKSQKIRNTIIKINDSKGCGSVMRVAGLLRLGEHYQLGNEELFKVAIHTAAITHGNEEGFAATGFFTLYLSLLAIKLNPHNAFKVSLGVTKSLRPNGFSNYIAQVYEESQKPKLLEFDELTNTLGLGWTADTAVGIALYCSLKAKAFKECLELSTNHSGDSDSTASMAAQLFAAEHGVQEYLFKTDVDHIIEMLCEGE